MTTFHRLNKPVQLDWKNNSNWDSSNSISDHCNWSSSDSYWYYQVVLCLDSQQDFLKLWKFFSYLTHIKSKTLKYGNLVWNTSFIFTFLCKDWLEILLCDFCPKNEISIDLQWNQNENTISFLQAHLKQPECFPLFYNLRFTTAISQKCQQ